MEHLTEIPLLAMIVGAVLLIAGRRLFWLFVGVIGFLVGMRFSPLQMLGTEPQWLHWLLAVVAGLLGMLLAVVLQRAAVAIAGFFVGGLAVTELLQLTPSSQPGLIAFIVAGIVAALLALLLLEGALIFLSSLAGAGMIVNALDLAGGTRGLTVILLVTIGIAIQAGITARRPRQST